MVGWLAFSQAMLWCVAALPGVYIGQNGAFGHGSFSTAVKKGWFDEREVFVYGSGAVNDSVVVGHYTQVHPTPIFVTFTLYSPLS